MNFELKLWEIIILLKSKVFRYYSLYLLRYMVIFRIPKHEEIKNCDLVFPIKYLIPLQPIHNFQKVIASWIIEFLNKKKSNIWKILYISANTVKKPYKIQAQQVIQNMDDRRTKLFLYFIYFNTLSRFA